MSARGRLAAKHALLIASIALGVGVVEGGLRLLTRTRASGVQVIRGVTLLPLRLPLQAVTPPAEGEGGAAPSYVRSDPALGWTHRAGGRSRGGLYQADTAGLRVERAGTTVTRAGRVGTARIAVFGDSFVHGDEVAFPDTWAATLETALDADRPTEVLNFGVGGYGTDQALLRWRTLGHHYTPDLVLVGLQPENVNRNLNLVRALYLPTTGIPFSKPRFVLRDGALTAVNLPAIAPAQLPAPAPPPSSPASSSSRASRRPSRTAVVSPASRRASWLSRKSPR